MLARPRPTGLALALAAGLLLAHAAPALADDGGVICPPRELDCDITAQDPGKPGLGKPGQGPGKPGGDGSGKPSCAIDGTPVPCSTPEMGVFSPADSCYWKETPGPAGGLPPGFDTGVPASWRPGDPGGSLYLVTCPNSAGDEIRGGIRWSATGPAGGGGGVQALAHQAVEKLLLEGPDIGIVPRPDGTGLVGMPVVDVVQPGSVPHGSDVGVGVGRVGHGHRDGPGAHHRVVDGGRQHRPVRRPGDAVRAAVRQGSVPDVRAHVHAHQRDGAGRPLPGHATSTWDIQWEGAGPDRDADGHPDEFHQPGDRLNSRSSAPADDPVHVGGKQGGDIGGDKGGSMGGDTGGSG
ncbi:hypothetical protein ACQEVM_33380 [Streptomyces sp. CA-243310]|uniref:hypothetical protein n=1 Tax=Streptomyces sp. CA-243310 TaxID=3240056 RepID=UPI003D94A4EB